MIAYRQIGYHCLAQLQDVLIPTFDEINELELDFAQLAYVSSVGLQVLLMGLKIAKVKAASMPVSNISQEIMEIFEMTEFVDMLTIT